MFLTGIWIVTTNEKYIFTLIDFNWFPMVSLICIIRFHISRLNALKSVVDVHRTTVEPPMFVIATIQSTVKQKFGRLSPEAADATYSDTITYGRCLQNFTSESRSRGCFAPNGWHNFNYNTGSMLGISRHSYNKPCLNCFYSRFFFTSTNRKYMYECGVCYIHIDTILEFLPLLFGQSIVLDCFWSKYNFL